MPVVLLHGIGSHAHSFVPLMQALGGAPSQLAWNAPGYGESKPLTVKWPDASDYAKALEPAARASRYRALHSGRSFARLR